MLHATFSMLFHVDSDVSSAEIVDIAGVVSLLGLIIVDHPNVIINDVLVVVLLRLLDVEDLEPLVGEWVKAQFVAHIPIVEGTAKLDTIVSWASVREGEGMAHLIERELIECRHDAVNFNIQFAILIIILLFVSSEVNFLENLTLLIASENLLNDANWLIVSWLPFLPLVLQFLDHCVVDKDLTFESEELSEPSFTDNFSIHGGLEGILSELEILWLISECSDSSLHCTDHVTSTVTLESVT